MVNKGKKYSKLLKLLTLILSSFDGDQIKKEKCAWLSQDLKLFPWGSLIIDTTIFNVQLVTRKVLLYHFKWFYYFILQAISDG